MKRILSTVFVLLVGGASVSAQNFYFRAGLGYGFAQAGQSMDGTGQPFNGTVHNNSSVQTYSIKSASFSAGVQGYLGFGYMVNNNVGIQLDAQLGISPKKYSLTATNVNLGGGITGDATVSQQADAPIFLVPSLVLQTGGDKLNIYTRFGLALPLSTKITQDQIYNYTSSGTPIVEDYTITVKNSFALGFAGAGGVKYNLNDRVSFWGELSLLSCTVYIKQTELTAMSKNGASYPVSTYPGNPITNYSKSATVDNTGATQPAYTQPFSNVGLNLGVSFNMGNSGSRRSNHSRSNEDNAKPYRRR